MDDVTQLVKDRDAIHKIILEEVYRRVLLYMDAYFSETNYDTKKIKLDEDLSRSPDVRVEYLLVKDKRLVSTGSLLVENVLSSEDSDLIRCGKEDAANHSKYKLINEEGSE